MTWADYRKGSKKAKIHLGFNLNQAIPAKIFLTDGKGPERPFVAQILSPGQTWVGDRGYQEHDLFDTLQAEGKSFVIRIKANTTKTPVIKYSVNPDSIGWIYGIVPDAGQKTLDFFREGPYGIWLLVCEIVIFGVVPAVILLIPKARKNSFWLIIGCIMNCIGVILNRFIYVIVTLAIPVMPFDKFWSYLPSWQEWGLALGVIGYGFLVFSVSYRYLPLFPKEQELNN